MKAYQEQIPGIDDLSRDETDEINELLKRLESMETMDDSEELQNQIMDTVNGYPELMQAMRQYNSEHGFEKEKVEYERLKLEEQISMLEKVIEEGIRQTTELQEIHHSEVEDLHTQIINLQRQVAAHVRFIDEHCIDSEEIRSEMQMDIDRLVVELEDQCRQNRSAESLQGQIERLETDFSDTQFKLKLADENQKRAEALLAARIEEKDQEVGDLNAEIKWFRQEYDALLLKVAQMEQSLGERRVELSKFEDETVAAQMKIKELTVKSDEYKLQLEDQAKLGKEQIEVLQNNLNEETNKSAKQRIELERLKTELDKAKDVIEKLKTTNAEISEASEQAKSEQAKSEAENASQMLARVATMTNDVTLRERLRLLEKKLERKSSAFDELKKENIRLREATARRRKEKSTERPQFKPMNPTRSLTDLGQTHRDYKSGYKSPRKLSNGKVQQTQNEDGSNCDSDDAGYCSSLRSFSRSLQSSTSLLSLDQSGLTEHYSHQRHYNGSRSHNNSTNNLRRCESLQTLSTLEKNLSPTMERYNFEPKHTSTPKRPSFQSQREFQSRSSLFTNDSKDSSDTNCHSSDSESLAEVQKVYLKPLQKSKSQKPLMVTTAVQTDQKITHSIKTQASPMMVTARVQTSPDKVKYYIKPREEFNTDTYLPAQRIREAARRPRDTVREGDISRLQEQLEDKRGDIRVLRQMLREKDEALARQNSDITNIKRQLSRHENRSRNAVVSAPSDSGHDISINLKEGTDDDVYGQIQQVRPGQIQELKTVRTIVKNMNGVPVKYSTKVSVKCQKVAVFF